MVLDGQDDGIAVGGPQIRTARKSPLYLCLDVTFLSHFLTHYSDDSHLKSLQLVHIVPCDISVSLSLSSLILLSSHCHVAVKRNTHGDSLGCDEGMLFDGSQDIRKLDFCCEGVSVVDDWHSIWTIPAVH